MAATRATDQHDMNRDLRVQTNIDATFNLATAGKAVNKANLRHTISKVTAVANTNTLDLGLRGLVCVAFQPDTATDICNVFITDDDGTVTFASGAGTHDGIVHAWSRL